MIDKKNVQGSEMQSVPLIIGKDTVYVHTNITKLEVDSFGNQVDNLYQYNEIQYDKDEYIKIMSEENQSLKTELSNTQLALVEIYEGMV